MAQQLERYDVALSYAGEDREQAQDLAQRLQTARYAVFFDEYERAQLLGANVLDKLQEIYEFQARYCVIFISQHYVSKPWTNQERQFALARAMRQPDPYVLPIRIDDSKLPGLPSTISYLDLRKIGMDQVFAVITKKLGPPTTVATESFPRTQKGSTVQIYPRNFLTLVVGQAEPRLGVFNLDCHIINRGDVRATVSRLEAHVRAPRSVPVQFTWNLFYDYLPSSSHRLEVMVKKEDTHEIELEPEKGLFIGVQFMGPRIDLGDLWTPGEYEFELYGWLNRRTRNEDVDYRTKFMVEVGAYEASALVYWSVAPQTAWDQLNDPDRAIAIPVHINERSIVAA